MFIGVTKGIEDTTLSAETVAEAIDEIDDARSFMIRGGPTKG